MNKQINQIAEQSRQYADEQVSGSFVKYNTDWFAFYNQKFAELIIEECAEVCVDVDGGENMFSRAVRSQIE